MIKKTRFTRATIDGKVVIPWQRTFKEVDNRSPECAFLEEWYGIRSYAFCMDRLTFGMSFEDEHGNRLSPLDVRLAAG